MGANSRKCWFLSWSQMGLGMLGQPLHHSGLSLCLLLFVTLPLKKQKQIWNSIRVSHVGGRDTQP